MDFESYIKQLQLRITTALSAQDTHDFVFDHWQKPENARGLTGYGITAVLKEGQTIEQGGVNISVVRGASLPPSATAKRPHLAGCRFHAMGLSLVIHPRNPYAPTSHANIRLIMAENDEGLQDWWFGGGFDLTPYYPFIEDCRHWHQVAREAAGAYYPVFKAQCDAYFYLPHREETRGIGGLFYDDFNDLPFEQALQLTQKIGEAYLTAYLPILEKRKAMPYGQKQREFQKYRRGRYVEFNLLYDRGTHFGLQSGGRVESILMSLPPEVRFEYRYEPEVGSEEAQLAEYLRPRAWLDEA